jgi:hypothetical protein
VRLYETSQAAVGAKSAAHALAAAVLHSMTVGYMRPLVLVAGVLLLVAGGSAGLTVALVGRPAAEPLARETPPFRQSALPRPGLPKAAPALDDPSHPVLPVTGRVLNAEGKPVPFAAVTALVRRPFRPGEQGLHDEVVARGQANEQGAFRLRVPAHFPTWFPERQVVLVAKAPGRAPLTTHVRLAEQGATEVDLRLRAAERIVRGRLLTPDGAAAPGVRLRVIRLGDVARETAQGAAEPGRQEIFWPVPVVSDAEGRFALSEIDPEQGVWLRVEDDRYAPDAFALRDADKPIEVRLKAAQVIEGCIVAADTGKGVPGVKLTARRTEPYRTPAYFSVPDFLSLSTRTLPPELIDGVSGADGRFRLRLPAGPQTILEVHPPVESPYLAVGLQGTWQEGVVRGRITAALHRGVVLRGRVVDEEGTPVAGASVMFDSPSPDKPEPRPAVLQGRYRIVQSGKDGRFRVTVPAGPVRLTAYGPTHEYQAQALRYWGLLEKAPERWGWSEPFPTERWSYAHAQAEMDAPRAEKQAELQLRLARGETVAGRVVGPDGELIKTAVLLCGEKVSPLQNATVQPLPVRDGRYKLPGCAAGRVYPVLLLDAANGWGAAVDLTVGRGAGPEVRLARCGSVRVRLVDNRGRPLAGRSLGLVLLTERSFSAAKPPLERETMDGHYDLWYNPLHYSGNQVSDAAGWLTLPALIPGARYLLEYTDGEGVMRHTPEFRVEPGEQLRLAELTLRSL